VQCTLSDPVSFALLAGSQAAAFPNVGGWSIAETAAEAHVEHLAWLARHRGQLLRGDHIAPLLSCGRAALFSEAVAAHAPELPLTLRATATSLGERYPRARGIAEEALASFAAWRRLDIAPPPRLAERLYRVVAELPAYRGALTRDASA
jgi:hypothetical protein